MAKKVSKKKKKEKKKLPSSALLVILGLVLLGSYALYGRSTPFENARDHGSRVEITRAESQKYFTYVSVAEARSLLADARGRGEFAFLFPQIDFGTYEKLIIQEHEIESANGEAISILGIEGLPPDAILYSNLDGTVRASVIEYDNADATDIVIFTGETDMFTSEFYLPYVEGDNDISEELRGVVDIAFGEPLIAVADGAYLKNDVFPAGWQMALVMQSLGGSGDGGANAGNLENVLTKNGKIVMVEVGNQ